MDRPLGRRLLRSLSAGGLIAVAGFLGMSRGGAAAGYVMTAVAAVAVVVAVHLGDRQRRRVAEIGLERDIMTGLARRAAHDLQAPLAVIDGWAAELATALGGAREQEMVDRIRGATREARSLVASVLADAVAGDRAPTSETVDLTSLAESLAADHAWHADIAVHEVGHVRGDPVQLRRLLSNLLDNAAKFVAPGERAQVVVSGTTRAGSVEVRVIDRGIGIPAGQHDRVFDELERATTDYPGTGLGLSICRLVAERHGGRIHAHVRDDGLPGTVVEVVLPASER